MRSLLIEDGNRLVLIDTGIGAKQDHNFFRHYYLHGDDELEGNLKKMGFKSLSFPKYFKLKGLVVFLVRSQ